MDKNDRLDYLPRLAEVSNHVVLRQDKHYQITWNNNSIAIIDGNNGNIISATIAGKTRSNKEAEQLAMNFVFGKTVNDRIEKLVIDNQCDTCDCLYCDCNECNCVSIGECNE